MSTKSTIKIQYVLFGEVKVPIYKWKGYRFDQVTERAMGWEELSAWCKSVGVMVDHHFEADPIQPDWLTLWTGEKYSGGKGCGYRVLPGMYVVRLPGSWPFLMCYTREEVVKLFLKISE